MSDAPLLPRLTLTKVPRPKPRLATPEAPKPPSLTGSVSVMRTRARERRALTKRTRAPLVFQARTAAASSDV